MYVMKQENMTNKYDQILIKRTENDMDDKNGRQNIQRVYLRGLGFDAQQPP